jgi:hypothetical protein
MRAPSPKFTAFLFLPPKGHVRPEQERARIALLRRIESEGWRCFTRRTRSVRVARGSESGRRLSLIEPWDAYDVYVAAHRQPTGIFQMGAARVLLDPSAAASPRNSVSLERFVTYKALFERVGAEYPLEPSILAVRRWLAARWCGGERDARCLPLHIFSPGRDWSGLEQETVVKRFESQHGRPTSRADAGARRWSPAAALHGQIAERIGGVVLRPGFHWDVSSPDGCGRFSNSTQVWRFSKDSYCNVYPSAVIRGGQRAGKPAKMVYEQTRPAAFRSVSAVAQGGRSGGPPRESR